MFGEQEFGLLSLVLLAGIMVVRLFFDWRGISGQQEQDENSERWDAEVFLFPVSSTNRFVETDTETEKELAA